MRQMFLTLLRTLRKSYGWRAERYEADAKSWRKQGQERLYCFYCGRAEEARAMIKEIDELILTVEVFHRGRLSK